MTDLIAGTGRKHLVRITAGGETTIATLAHPYYLADEQRWIPAGSLSAGDRLLRPDGSVAVVELVTRFTVLRATVHNLTVGAAHTYYAGADPVLVHNDGCGPRGSEGNPFDTSRQARRQSVRDAGIPTSQQPVAQRGQAPYRQYEYEVPKRGGGTESKVVTRNATTDRGQHAHPHWEAARPKANRPINPYGTLRYSAKKVTNFFKQL